ncbi:hypothetical protein CRG98_032841 [Punica granatum]|uniref:Uncharacterized protein n=1 Tax=Punica granatum TaxID=22663 RepID=A0A2I0IS07_PUNGR|nr:hypothetical protein CRG98_032841 [Punica granatum]
MFPCGPTKWNVSEWAAPPVTLLKFALRYMSTSPCARPAAGSSMSSFPVPMTTKLISHRAATSASKGRLFTAYPTLLPLQYMTQSGSYGSLTIHSRTVWRIPPCISFARTFEGTAISRRRTGSVDLGSFCTQKISFPPPAAKYRAGDHSGRNIAHTNVVARSLINSSFFFFMKSIP